MTYLRTAMVFILVFQFTSLLVYVNGAVEREQVSPSVQGIIDLSQQVNINDETGPLSRNKMIFQFASQNGSELSRDDIIALANAIYIDDETGPLYRNKMLAQFAEENASRLTFFDITQIANRVYMDDEDSDTYRNSILNVWPNCKIPI